jgi:hypothetical protein
MRAFVVREYSHPSGICLSLDAPTPVPNSDEILVEVFSAGLNFFDVSRVVLETKKSAENTRTHTDPSSTGKVPKQTTLPVRSRCRVRWPNRTKFTYPERMSFQTRGQGIRIDAGMLCRQSCCKMGSAVAPTAKYDVRRRCRCVLLSYCC